MELAVLAGERLFDELEDRKIVLQMTARVFSSLHVRTQSAGQKAGIDFESGCYGG